MYFWRFSFTNSAVLFSRSDFVTLPFQGAEVLLDNIAPLPGTTLFIITYIFFQTRSYHSSLTTAVVVVLVYRPLSCSVVVLPLLLNACHQERIVFHRRPQQHWRRWPEEWPCLHRSDLLPHCIKLKGVSQLYLTICLSLSVKVSNYDNNTGLPLVHLWNMVGEEVRCVMWR